MRENRGRRENGGGKKIKNQKEGRKEGRKEGGRDASKGVERVRKRKNN